MSLAEIVTGMLYRPVIIRVKHALLWSAQSNRHGTRACQPGKNGYKEKAPPPLSWFARCLLELDTLRQLQNFKKSISAYLLSLRQLQIFKKSVGAYV